MNSVLTAVGRYQQAVTHCIAAANDALSGHAEIKLMLDQLNYQALRMKSCLLNISLEQVESQSLYENLLVLEKNANDLNEIVASAKAISVGRLGEVFDALRSASNRLHELLPDEMEIAMPTIIKCHEDLNAICSRLVQSCFAEVEILEAIGISKLVYPHLSR